MDGALVLGEGLTFRGEGGLVLPGGSLRSNERERVPGFDREGALRPGLLSVRR